MTIKTFEYNDPELLKTIVHLLGDTDWTNEHGQALIRQKTKIFHLMFDGEIFVSMFSENKKVIGDCHTEPAYRNRGHMKELLSAFTFETGTRAVTKSEGMKHIFQSIGFVECGKNGRFTKFKKVIG